MPSKHPAAETRHVALDSRHGSLEQLVGELMPRARLELNRPGGEINWRAEYGARRGLAWWQVDLDSDVALDLIEEEKFAVSIPLSGATETRIRNRTFVAAPGGALVMGVPETPKVVCHSRGGYRCLTLKFDIGHVTGLVSRLYEGATLGQLELAPCFDLSSSAGATVVQLAQTIATTTRGRSLHSPMAAALLDEAMLRLIFDHVPHRLGVRSASERSGPSPRHVRMAVDFMHANMHEPLTAGRIAEAVGVSERSLQIGFRRFRDTTPLAYLRDIRLAAVHAELSAPGNRLSVADVAEKWGFVHLGRFAARYRATFGTLPSETARGVPGRVNVTSRSGA